MYYEPGATDHNLPYDPFKSCVVPRPIGWISTIGADGADNLAPYSQFQNIGFDPPTVMFSANQNSTGGRKNSVVNAEQAGEFVWNMATYALREAVNLSSEELPLGVDEFAIANLTKAASKLVKPKRVAESPVHFECKYLQTVRLPGNGIMGTVDVVFGRVVAIHIDDSAIREGRIDIAALRPLARLGYYDYTSVEHVFTMAPPGQNARIAAGLEGSPLKAKAAFQS
jgi:flavin reductase (DIM6/NTAB) family NADH-FMN oxidoreductase RutF